jgi:hypothetical protein
LHQVSKLEAEIADLAKQLVAAGADSLEMARQLADKVNVIERAVSLANAAGAELAEAQKELVAFLANPAAALAKHLSIERVYDIISSSLPSAERLRARLMEGGLGSDIYMEDPDKSRGGPGGK